jgi:hypothetical protein
LSYVVISSVVTFVARFCFFCFCFGGELVGSSKRYFFGSSLAFLGGCMRVWEVCLWCFSGGEHTSVRGSVGCLLFCAFGWVVSSWLCRGERGGVVCPGVCCVCCPGGVGCVGKCMLVRCGKSWLVYALTYSLCVTLHWRRSAIPNARLWSSSSLEFRCISPVAVLIGSKY